MRQPSNRRMKLWILRLGATQGDVGWFLRGRNSSTVSNPTPDHDRRRMMMFAMLIDHPDNGLVLYDCGSVPDPSTAWGPDFADGFPWIEYADEHRLDRAIALTGNSIDDVKAIVLSHLHLDHAGGLHYFEGRKIPIYVHEDELRQAFYAVATKEDYGNYLPDYLSFEHNWQPLTGSTVEIFRGMTLHLLPGHANGLMGLMLDLPNTGPVFFTSDQCVFRENLEDFEPPGWGLRNQDAWYASNRRIRRIVDLAGARVFYGHDEFNLTTFECAPHHYD
ncbi:N-acyl homoserine lactonase family protein [Rhizobium multihospitium]|uniref:quorum-quenching N-acyl-homoserine lactonase n=1 Tax=Rhizobium multihospitium TaxID=410764 RepID=A0A1C3X5L9_9HYPH|nr:N-acyl homoserine lactonase family protein [Rhizobium multihospitium]SCB47517.1 Metallo-beta-lactamase superfamily protein [Rhizobium multihospitium]